MWDWALELGMNVKGYSIGELWVDEIVREREREGRQNARWIWLPATAAVREWELGWERE
jgi:hypothetical protein